LPLSHESGSGAASEFSLRVSVATYNRLVFPHPQNGMSMLPLERKATVRNGGAGPVHVKAQPFGGGVRILNPAPLQVIIGEIRFDSEQSKQEQDFRVLIPPSQWEAVKQYCLRHLENPADRELESLPHRELAEEFAGTLNVSLTPEQYAVQPLGFVVENEPVPTENIHVLRQPTVRLYRIFEVRIVEAELCKTMLAANQQYSDQDLGMLALTDAQNGGKGQANSVLILPLHMVTESYLKLAPERRYSKIVIEGHELDESVLVILGEVEVPQYQRMWEKRSAHLFLK